ncbi:hypothetical protein [Aromatoleum aromaticum]|uniref:hypothetical protein n=1 Tax=Aromatoleum aromaticum TaxID=551760 RepID=UPI0012FE8BD5|nr:hypothetical protein [Aromatoleum aromaticum]NMG56253.1 hypothetical protein [Aromatoleum aromaticum]
MNRKSFRRIRLLPALALGRAILCGVLEFVALQRARPGRAGTRRAAGIDRAQS